MTIQPGNLDITIYQGADFSQVLTWKDDADALVNLTGATAALMARTTRGDAGPFISLSSGNGITLGGSAGTITIAMTAIQTAALTASSGVYDLKITLAGVVYRLLEGDITIKRAVTT